MSENGNNRDDRCGSSVSRAMYYALSAVSSGKSIVTLRPHTADWSTQSRPSRPSGGTISVCEDGWRHGPTRDRSQLWASSSPGISFLSLAHFPGNAFFILVGHME